MTKGLLAEPINATFLLQNIKHNSDIIKKLYWDKIYKQNVKLLQPGPFHAKLSHLLMISCIWNLLFTLGFWTGGKDGMNSIYFMVIREKWN